MTHVKLTKGFIVSGAADLDAHTDVVMDQLVALEDERISDADVSVDFSKDSVEISVVAHADSFDEAVEQADAAIRTAIHAAGGSTAGWTRVKFTPQTSNADLVHA